MKIENAKILCKQSIAFKSYEKPPIESHTQDKFIKQYGEDFIPDKSLAELILIDTPKNKQEIYKKFMDIPEYNICVLSLLNEKKPDEVKRFYDIAAKRDKWGQLRIPPEALPHYAKIPIDTLENYKTILLKLNDLGIWAFTPEIIKTLEKLDEKQLFAITKLSKNNVEAENILEIIKNKNLNWEKTIEKTESLNKLYGKDLREISFFSNRNNENFLSADIQLSHIENKPDWTNFKRVFAQLDNDVNPIMRLKSKAKIDLFVDNIYNKIEKNLYIFSEKDLNTAISNIKAKIPDTNEQEILKVMQRLTQFANYSSLKELSEKLKKINVGFINPEGILNEKFQYFHHNKKILSLSESENSLPVYFIDETKLSSPSEIENIKNANLKNSKFVILDGWSNGINLFCDDKKLEEKTYNILSKSKSILEKNPDLTLDEAIDKALYDKTEEQLKKLGITLNIIKLKAPYTKSQILDQMRPIMPTHTLIKSTIESISKYYTKNNQQFSDLCLRIAKYYEDNINVYSKQSIIENLKIINTKINDYLKQNNLPKENLYFIIPDIPFTRKSFDIIIQMYKDLYNIPDEKIIKILDITDIENYPENSTFVALDDIVASGNSMISIGDYLFYASELPEKSHILFAPITASQKGITHIENFINNAGRNNNDAIINISENTKDYTDTKDLFFSPDNSKNQYAKQAFGEEGYGKGGLCTVFPYMDPDNNSSLAGYLTKFFVPDSQCLKSKTDLIPIIEEKTYFYDIFGTDKEHIMTDSNRAYNPPSKGILMKIKNIFI